MFTRLLSGDMPRSKILTIVLVLIIIGLLVTPFLFPGARALNAAAKICVFIVLVASYDLLLGYTGIVSFAHTMFFGIGSYAVGIMLDKNGATWVSVIIGTVIALVISLLLAFLIGLFSLRVRAIFYAMITLAVASSFSVLASQLSNFTGGEDGLNIKVPDLLEHSYKLGNMLRTEINGKVITYYLIFLATIVLFLVFLRIVNSPFGRVLLSIRENDFRAEAIGYKTVVYRTLSNCIGAVGATLAGVMYVLWLRHAGPDVTLSFAVMMDILLMVVIGGFASMYGAIIGATLLVLAHNYLQLVMKFGSERLADIASGMGGGGMTKLMTIFSNLIHPDRWLLWLGVCFILCVYFFPWGIVGKLRTLKAK